MRVKKLSIGNFRGIRKGDIEFADNTLLVGGNNSGKSTICEALDLVLGPERLLRRPVVNEHDFYNSQYLDDDGMPIEIRVEALLIDLSIEAERRFGNYLRLWNEAQGCFADEEPIGSVATDSPDACWALSVVFLGWYDKEEDDFIGRTFFAHPKKDIADEDEESYEPGAGLTPFLPEHKRICGFLFLRYLRTGTRAFSLQHRSLLDTILRLDDRGRHEMWEGALRSLKDLSPAIGDIEQLKIIRDAIAQRMNQFVGLAAEREATAFFASDLTRENIREVVHLFMASEQSNHPVPFRMLGSGTINALVFALLTFIADQIGKHSVIFAMEEPEIALPPHTQRRTVQYSLREMGQTIVTSHSPYVIEQFEPNQIVMLERALNGSLHARSVNVLDVKPKTFKAERKQFAEAMLSRAVLVVEGSTEMAIFPAASSVLERTRGERYTHFDLAGITMFNAGSESDVPRYGSIFKALGKKVFGFVDKPAKSFSENDQSKLEMYDIAEISEYKGIEDLLVTEMQSETLQSFLAEAKKRADYPQGCRYPQDGMHEEDIRNLARKVLIARKGDTHGYGALLIATCRRENELPVTIRSMLDKIQVSLNPSNASIPPDKKGGRS